MHRRWVIALVVAAVCGATVSLALAQSDKAPTAYAAQTTTTPEDIGQDFGNGTTSPSQGATSPQQQLPFTGWRGRDAVILGLLLLGSGFWLRAVTAGATRR